MNLEESLKDISNTISSEDSQLRLQQLLSNDLLDDLQSTQAQELLKEISAALSRSLLESKIYHMITSGKHLQESEENSAVNKSVLDFRGNFFWSDKSCEKFFRLPFCDLEKVSIFHLMSPSSLRYLYSRYSSELLSKSNRIIISYTLTNGVELTSRCTKVIYSCGNGEYSYGVFMETRFCKHRIHYFGMTVSPICGSDNLLFTPLQITPSMAGISGEVCMFDMESLRITPFLKSESPYKKMKIDDYYLNEY